MPTGIRVLLRAGVRALRFRSRLLVDCMPEASVPAFLANVPPCFDQSEDVVVEPRRMYKLDGVFMLLRQLTKECVEALTIFVEHRRQLPENLAETCLHGVDALKENGDGFRFYVQFLHLRYDAAPF